MSLPSSVLPRRQIFSGLPVFWQVLGLALLVLVLALGINTLVVLKAPEPPPSGYTITEAVQALKTGEARLQNGRRLKARTQSDTPDFVQQNPVHRNPIWPFTQQISQKLATELHVPSDTVWVHIMPRRPFNDRDRRNFDPRSGPQPGQMGGPGPMPQGPGQGPDQASQDGAPPPPQPYPQSWHQNGPSPNGREEGHLHEENRLNVSGAGTREEILYPAFSAAWKLADGTYRVIEPPQSLIAPWQGRLLLGFGLTALLILPLVWWLSRRLSRPIVALSEAAEKLSVEDNAPPVVMEGPREVQAAADVLNEMQARIRKQMESRTALMGAIAHDLKTPLARMRLRIEDLPAPIRDKLNGDIAHMDGLIRSAMSFTSAHKMGETIRPLDLSSLIEALDEDLSVTCEMEPPLIEGGLMVKGDQVAIKRIVTNLVENAGRYANGCRIELSSRGRMAELRIIDNGPGLPPEALETVFEPFFRMESSRNRDTGGTGLGLSVARALAEAQGGQLTLSNRYAGTEILGLEALLTLPKLAR